MATSSTRLVVRLTRKHCRRDGLAGRCLTLGVGALPVLAALRAVFLQNRLVERRTQIERGATALAPVTTLLTSVEPDRLAVNASEESLRELQELRAHWEASVRVPLATFALSHPSRQIRDLATELDVHVEWVLIRGVSVVRDVLSHRDPRPVQEMVWGHYRDAKRLIDELHEAIHRSRRRLRYGRSNESSPVSSSR